MLVLALDTSTPALTAGVLEVDGDQCALLAERTVVDPFAHAEQLMPLLRQALADAGRSFGDAGAVVVGLGPGPFTGLRVGIASAAALGDGLAIPAYGVPSHQAFWLAAGGGDVLVATDARRREVYASVFADGSGLAGPVPLVPSAVAGWLADMGAAPVGVTGAGASLVESLGLPRVEPVASTSEGLVMAASGQLAAGLTPGALVPLYLRRPDASEPSATRKSVLGR